MRKTNLSYNHIFTHEGRWSLADAFWDCILANVHQFALYTLSTIATRNREKKHQHSSKKKKKTHFYISKQNLMIAFFMTLPAVMSSSVTSSSSSGAFVSIGAASGGGGAGGEGSVVVPAEERQRQTAEFMRVKHQYCGPPGRCVCMCVWSAFFMLNTTIGYNHSAAVICTDSVCSCKY